MRVPTLLYLLAFLLAPPAAAESQRQRLLGTWCLEGVSETLESMATVDGSWWSFSGDGRFTFRGGIRQSGAYSLDGDRLEIEDVGTFEIIDIGESKMILLRYAYHHFQRDECGEAVRRANGITVLVNAAYLGNLQVVQKQIESGVDIDARETRSSRESTALHVASDRGHLAIVEYLLGQGADPTVENFLEQTPLDLARKKGRKEIVELLEKALKTRPE